MPEHVRLSTETYADFQRRFDAGKFTSQRLGQAFCNHFRIHNPVLFYTASPGKAQRLINRYIEDYQL